MTRAEHAELRAATSRIVAMAKRDALTLSPELRGAVYEAEALLHRIAARERGNQRAAARQSVPTWQENFRTCDRGLYELPKWAADVVRSVPLGGGVTEQQARVLCCAAIYLRTRGRA